MLIRSQDKMYIFKLDCLEIEQMDTTGEWIVLNIGRIVGRYSTREKAIKVLDMIEDIYKSASLYGTTHLAFQFPEDDCVRLDGEFDVLD